VQSKRLLTESEVFKDEVLSGTESTDNHPRRCRNDVTMAKIMTRILPKHAASSPSPNHSFCKCREVLTRDRRIVCKSVRLRMRKPTESRRDGREFYEQPYLIGACPISRCFGSLLSRPSCSPLTLTCC